MRPGWLPPTPPTSLMLLRPLVMREEVFEFFEVELRLVYPLSALSSEELVLCSFRSMCF